MGHSHEHGHSHGLVDPSIVRSRAGVRAVAASFGVLGAANIGRVKVIPAMQRSVECEVVALASRSLETARETAAARAGVDGPPAIGACTIGCLRL